jgi:ABC-type phosphate transport system substrate-binding protein
MAVSLLQRNAFVTSDDFNDQVNGIVSKTAIYRTGIWTDAGNMDDNTRNLLAQVARSPESYGFTSVIVTDNNWNMTYDAWATDPPGADDDIESKVQAHWLLLTGIKEPMPPEPAP